MKKILALLLFYALNTNAQTSEKFEFVYSVKTGSVANIYYSSENLFMKDMVVDPPQKIKLKLTNEDRISIQNKISEIDFYEYPNEYKFISADPNGLMAVNDPCTRYTLTIYENDKCRSVTWTNCNVSGKSKNNKFENLTSLQRHIDKMLNNKIKTKIKKPRAAYL